MLILVLSSVIVFERLNLHNETFKTSISLNINSIFQDISNSSTRIFSLVSSNPQFSEFTESTLDEDDFILTKKTTPMTQQLKNMYINGKYISRICVYSYENQSLISNTAFDKNISQNPGYSKFVKILEQNKSSHYFTTIITDSYDAKEKLCFIETIENDGKTTGAMCIMINLINLKTDINRILQDTDISFALIDNKNDELLFSSDGFEPKALSAKKDDSTCATYDQNIRTVISYTNYKPLSNMKMVLIPLVFIMLLLIIITAYISYIRAQKIYAPIGEIIKVIDTPENLPYINIPQEMIDYAEIKYIINAINTQKKNVFDLKKQTKKYTAAKKQALQAQISPHFIANTLEVINLEAYSLTNTENTVTEMICQLSDIMRINFQTGARLLEISEELLLTKQYINIQNIRYSNLFNVKFEIEPEVNNYLTPHLILQPLVENAINHGILPKKARSSIILKAYEKQNKIYFDVIDNGVGINPEKLKEIHQLLESDTEPSGKSIGLQNVNMRIKIIFGDEYGLSVTSDENGTKQSIVIPKNQ